MSNLPNISRRFFQWYCNPLLEEQILGDLQEQFEEDIKLYGVAKAKWRFTWNVIRFFRPGIIKNFEGIQRLNNYGMLKHNLKVAFRNLVRQKGIAFINIGGLVLGLLVTLMIGLWVLDEWSWDKDNENYDRVVRIMQKRVFNDEVSVTRGIPLPLAAELQENYGDVFEHIVLSSFYWDALIYKGDDAVKVRGVLMQSSAPYMMSLEMIRGTRDGLKEEAALLLSESAAYALFGDIDPINQTVRMDDNLSMIVRGVYEDLPSESSFNGIGFIGSWDYHAANNDWLQEKAQQINWESNVNQLFAILATNTSIEASNEKLKSIINDHLPEEKQNKLNAVFLHPMKDWHLKSSWENGIQSGGDIIYVRWFVIIGLLVLFLACINFMNLSTAQSIRRAKEVGIRKSIGSVRHQLVTQFMTESTLLVFLSFLLMSGISILVTPFFNHLTDKQISLPVGTWQYWLFGLSSVLALGILSGSYPALYLSSFRPIQVLKGTYQSPLSATIFRKAMVVFQFTISIALIIGTIIIANQVDHVVSRPLGYDSDKTISVQLTYPEYLKEELVRSGVVAHLAESSNPLTETWMANNDFSWIEKDPVHTPMFNTIYVSHDFGNTVNWKIIKGRDFNSAFSSDSTALVINESAAQTMGVDNPVGLEINWQGSTYKIIGIVEDLLSDSPFRNIEPTFYFFIPEHFRNFTLIRLNDQLPEAEAIMRIAEVHEKLLPNVPFEFEFVSDEHDRKFQSINRIGSLSGIFSLFAIIISCLGLFGLSSFMVEQRTKEIGIRKVLGASMLQLWRLLSFEFIVLVAISSIIAIPISLWVLKSWLEGYEYSTELNWWIFAVACLGALVLTLVTTSFKSFTTIGLNPARTLKDE